MSEEDLRSVAVVETESDPALISRGALAGLKLPSAVHAIAWSTGAAAITWLAACLGQTYMEGRFSALGLDGLSPPQSANHSPKRGSGSSFSLL